MGLCLLAGREKSHFLSLPDRAGQVIKLLARMVMGLAQFFRQIVTSNNIQRRKKVEVFWTSIPGAVEGWRRSFQTLIHESDQLKIAKVKILLHLHRSIQS